MRVVQRADHPAFAGTDTEVVLGDLPATCLGTVPGSCIRTQRRPHRRTGGHRSRGGADDSPKSSAARLGGPPTGAATKVEQGAVHDRHLIAIAAVLDDVVRAVQRQTRPFSVGTSPQSWG
jgi:hypothetical protein